MSILRSFYWGCGSGVFAGSGILKSLDPEFSNDLDPDPYFERPGSRSKFIAPKSYLSNYTLKILNFFRSDPDPCFLVNPDPYF